MSVHDTDYSLWLDFVERDFLQEAFPALIHRNAVSGATSNPSIFAQAIAASPAYAAQLATLPHASPKEKYEALAIDDIRTAAHTLRPVYDQGRGGYISIEVDPFLSDNADATLKEARRLFAAIGQPNVMIKIPATEAGYPVMEALLRDGISVNATLVFSPQQAERCFEAMQAGIHAFGERGGGRVDAVISVFVSRFDRLLDAELADKGLPAAKTGIMNAAKIYHGIEVRHHPNIQTLFASTGVKGDHLPADYYVQALCAPHAINTAPLVTIEAALANALPSEVTLPNAEEADRFFDQLASAGVEMEHVYDRLLHEGLVAFEAAFSSMLASLE